MAYYKSLPDAEDYIKDLETKSYEVYFDFYTALGAMWIVEEECLLNSYWHLRTSSNFYDIGEYYDNRSDWLFITKLTHLRMRFLHFMMLLKPLFLWILHFRNVVIWSFSFKIVE